MDLRAKAERLRALHRGPAILRLPNVWDAAGARIVEKAGFPAAATTSAGIAFALGYPDGERIPRDEMLGQVRRIARVLSIPLTADLEAGYEDIEETAAGLVAAGAVGLNLEDAKDGALVDIPVAVEKIRAVRSAGGRLGVPIVINAHCDIYLLQAGDPSTRFSRTVERLEAYKAAGADCLFVPLVEDEETIARLVQTLRFPVNILATAGAPPAGRLQELGVARVSLGSGPMRAALGLMRRIAEELRDQGTYAAMLDGAIPYREVNELLG
ncbi:MAG: isocitrate lyase/phosphoenolpyruvate mutase family protein [Bryobacteraceae bacterium]|nr:isocitrate lyase/phosphoenolpyruvate mutase family protein [Bryobacteraceae bacterium]